jgi:hypothetical protein
MPASAVSSRTLFTAVVRQNKTTKGRGTAFTTVQALSACTKPRGLAFPIYMYATRRLQDSAEMDGSGALLEIRKSKSHCCAELVEERCFVGNKLLLHASQRQSIAETAPARTKYGHLVVKWRC